MNVVERILSKVVGQEISPEELDEVSGGLKDWCTGVMGGYYSAPGEGSGQCDWP